MMERRCDCLSCRARRLAILLAAAGLFVLIGVCIHFAVDPAPGTFGAQIESTR